MNNTSRTINENVFAGTAAVLKTLGHPDRLKMLSLLAGERLTVSSLAGKMNLASNAVSQHLSNMLTRGILARNRTGRCVYYTVKNSIAKNLIRCMMKNNME